MNNLKKFLRKWLEVPEPPNIDSWVKDYKKQVEAEIQKSRFRLDWFLNEYHTNTCLNCKRPILAHYGGFYRNSKGEVFCSHECIDANKKP